MDCIQDSTRVSTDVNCASKKITCGEHLQVPGGWRRGPLRGPSGPGHGLRHLSLAR